MFGIVNKSCAVLSYMYGYGNCVDVSNTSVHHFLFGIGNCKITTVCDETVQLGTYNTITNGTRSQIIGFCSSSCSSDSVLIGTCSCTQGNNSFITGNFSCTTAGCATVIGTCSSATHCNATVIGAGLSSKVSDTVHMNNFFLAGPTGPYASDACFYAAGGTAGQAYLLCVGSDAYLTIGGYN
jgi:hypothetical protein